MPPISKFGRGDQSLAVVGVMIDMAAEKGMRRE